MKFDRFEIVIHEGPKMKGPQDVAHKLIQLGKLLLTNQTLIQNCQDHGGNGMIVDASGNQVGKWIFVVEQEKK